MAYCQLCGKDVYSQGDNCPECGSRLSEHQSTGERRLPRIVSEESNRPISKPLIIGEQSNQQATNYQHQAQEQFQTEHQQPYYENQEYIQEEYQQPYYQVNSKPEKKSLCPVIIISIGGILAMICVIALFRVTSMGFSITADMSSLDEKYTYFWLVPISGMLAVLFGIFGHLTQKKQMVWIIMILGIILLILPLIFAAQFSEEGNASIGEVFYFSEQTGIGNFSNLFIGGILAMIGGLMEMIGGMLLLKIIGKKRSEEFD